MGTSGGGNTSVTLGNGHDFVQLNTGAHNSVSLGSGNGDTIWDFSNGTDSLSVQNGNGDWIYASGTHPVSIHMGNGINDVAEHEGGGNAAISVGTGLGDTVEVGSGVDTVSFGAHAPSLTLWDTLDLDNLTAQSFTPQTTASQVSVLAGGLDVVSGLAHGDHIDLPGAASGDTVGGVITNLAGVAGEVVFSTGTLSGGVFTYSAGGHDALMIYDNGSGGFVDVALVGGAAEAAHAHAIGGGVILF
jgi:hypothetical protein